MQVTDNQRFTPPYIKRTNKLNSKNYFKLFWGNWVIIALILIITGCALGLRSYNREVVSDDLLYQYVLDENPLGKNEYIKKVENFQDAIESQSNQYFGSNGRFIVHVFVQMFAGVWGQTAYAIFLGILGICIISCLLWYTINLKFRTNPLLWLFASICLLYLFQSNSSAWYSYAGGWNYFYPMLPSLLFLIVYHKICTANNLTLLCKILLFIFGLIAGWSQECYALPLSAGFFFYCLPRIKQIKSDSWILIVALWIGCALLVFAPGNFIRLEGGKGLIGNILDGLDFLSCTWLFWLLVLSLIILRISSKNKYHLFVKKERLNFLILLFSLLLGLVANTLPQSFNGISFYSVVLFFKVLNLINWDKLKNKYYLIFSSLLLVLFSIHQGRIIYYSAVSKDFHHNFVLEYMNSEDGVLKIRDIELPKDVSPFVKNWFKSTVLSWTLSTITKIYGSAEKPLRALEEKDYKTYHEGILKGLSAGQEEDNNVFVGEKYIWMGKENIAVRDSIEVTAKQIKKNGVKSLLINLKKRIKGESEIIKTKVPVDSALIIVGKDIIGIPYGDYEIMDLKVIKH